MSAELNMGELAELERTAALRPDEPQHVQALADAYADLGRWQEAAETYQAALDLDPGNADLHNNLATVYEELGDVVLAETHYRKAGELRPIDPTPLYNLGVLYEDQQRVSEAIWSYEQFLDRAIGHEERVTVARSLANLYPASGVQAYEVWYIGPTDREKWVLRLRDDEAVFISSESGQLVSIPRVVDFAQINEAPDADYNLEVERAYKSYRFLLEPDALESFRSWLPAGDVAAFGAPVPNWRLLAAGIYGLVAALAAGYLWYLLVLQTGRKYGIVAIAIGLVVGLVVSFVGGGNRDTRYSVLGAALSAAGIATGEFLLYGLSSSIVYDFSFTDLAIYFFAVFEGWIIPRRSYEFARRGGAIITEERRPVIMAAGLAGLVLAAGGVLYLAWSETAAMPDLSAVVLTADDFPSTFIELPVELLGMEVGQPIDEDSKLTLESGFATVSMEPMEMVYGFTVLLRSKADQKSFDQEIMDQDGMINAMYEGMAEGSGVAHVEVVDSETIGDASLMFTMEADVDGMPFRMDMITCRRDVVGAFVVVMYTDGETPQVTVEQATQMLDDLVVEALNER